MTIFIFEMASSKILAAVPDLGFRAEDARAIGLSLFIART